MYSLYSEDSEPYPALPEPATTMQIVSHILVNAKEELNSLAMNISGVSPSLIHRLQKELDIPVLIYRDAGKNTIVFPPEARDSLYAYAVKELEKTMAVHAQAPR
jgi:hypothetical protein